MLAMLLLPILWARADVYVDDTYYWADGTDSEQTGGQPSYNRRARELVFIDDTVAPADTVRIRITERQ